MKKNQGKNRFEVPGKLRLLFTGVDGVRTFFDWLDKRYPGFFIGVSMKDQQSVCRKLAQDLNTTKQSKVRRKSNITSGTGW